MTPGSSLAVSRRVLVTRASHQIGKLSEKLREAGCIPVEVPVIEIQPPESFEALDAALRRLPSYDWLILTSANTVRALVNRTKELGLSLIQPESLNVAAVGQGTADAAIESGFRVDLIPTTYLAESLVSGLLGGTPGSRFLLARAAMARDAIPDALREAGAHVDVVDAYQNGMPKEAPDQLRHAVSDGLDAVTFTSSSSVIHLRAAALAADLVWPFTGVAAISIGPITTGTLREENWAAATEAEVSDIPGLVKAVVGHFEAK